MPPKGLDVPVATPEVAGVTLRRHILDRNAAALARVADELMKRCRNGVRKLGPDELPSEAFLATFKEAGIVVLGLLKEQRERAKLKPGNGAPAIDDATFEKQLGELVRQTIVTMPKRELDELMRLRAIDVSAGDAQVTQAHDLRPVEQVEQVHQPTSPSGSVSRPARSEPDSEADGDASTTPVDFLSELERKP